MYREAFCLFGNEQYIVRRKSPIFHSKRASHSLTKRLIFHIKEKVGPICICIRKHLATSTHEHTRTHTHIHSRIRIYTHTYIHIYTCHTGHVSEGTGSKSGQTANPGHLSATCLSQSGLGGHLVGTFFSPRVSVMVFF